MSARPELIGPVRHRERKGEKIGEQLCSFPGKDLRTGFGLLCNDLFPACSHVNSLDDIAMLLRRLDVDLCGNIPVRRAKSPVCEFVSFAVLIDENDLDAAIAKGRLFGQSQAGIEGTVPTRKEFQTVADAASIDFIGSAQTQLIYLHEDACGHFYYRFFPSTFGAQIGQLRCLAVDKFK